MYLIERIKEYQKRYETETYNPELNCLLTQIRHDLGYIYGLLCNIMECLQQ